MAFYLSPLVAVNEIDLSTTIPAVATSIGVIALRDTYKGAEKKQTFISSETDLIRAFGEPDADSYEDMLSALGFLRYGNKLYATRVAPDNAKFAGVTVDDAGTGDAFKFAGTGLTFDLTDAGVAGVLETGELVINSVGSGYRVNDTVTVVGGNNDGIVTVDAVGATGNVTAFTITAGGTGYVDGTLETTALSGHDVGFPTGTLADISSEDPDDFGDDVTVTTANDLVWVIASSRGAWGNNVRLAFMDKTTQEGILNGTTLPSTFVGGGSFEKFYEIDSRLNTTKNFLVLVQVKDQRKNTFVTKEVFNVSTDADELDDAGRKLFVEDVINGSSQYVRVSVDASLIDVAFDSDLVSDGWFTLSGGSDGVWSGNQMNTALIDAYRLYDNAEEIDVNIFIDSGKAETVKSELIVICEERKDCMAVLDVPYNTVVNNRGNEVVDLRTWRTSTFNENTSYASVYANWIEVYDKYNQKYRWIPASGYMAGIYAKTDDVADPWWAPAGLNRAILGGVRRLAFNPNQGSRDILYSNGLNPVVSFSGQGKVVWGQKTLLAKESAFNRVNVRRLFLVLEKAISTAAKYFLFEPNDPITRSLLIGMIEPFLRDVQARRGIYDFKVVCDETINTPERVDRNELWCNIFIKPTRTAEFIVLNFIATKTGASFDELSGSVG